MSVPKAIHTAKGLWRGKSKLNLPWLAPDKRVTESSSSLHIDTDGQDKFATITYDWHYQDKREEGTMLLSSNAKSKRVQIGWVDSWHQNDGVLLLIGEESPTGAVKVKGEYSAGKEVWGWTIEIAATSDTLTVKMENVPPTGDAMWAVEGAYKRD